MKQEILFVLLKDFADWEGAYIAPYLNYGCGPDIESKYVVKTVSVTKAPVVSCGGFTRSTTLSVTRSRCAWCAGNRSCAAPGIRW